MLGGILVFTAVLAAALPAQAEPLTWEKAVSIARDKNPEILSAQSFVKSARAAYLASLSGFFPQVTGSAGVTHFDTAGDGAPSASDRSMSLSAQQSLFSGFGTKAAADSAEARWRARQALLSQAEAQARSDLRTSFADLLYAQENVSLLEKIHGRRRDNRDLIKLRYKAGRENLGSLLRAEALLSRASFELARAGREQSTSKIRLARTLGVKSDSIESAAGDFSVIYSSITPDIAGLVRQTPSALVSQYQYEGARSQVAFARSDFFPDLSLSAVGRRSLSDGSASRDSWSAGGSISYNFFSGASDLQGVRQARADLSQASYDFDSVLRETEADLEEFHAGFVNAAELVKVQEEFLKASQERAKIARAQYSNGLVSFQDWDLIENDLINSEKDSLTARRGAVLAEAAWDRAVGKGLETP